MLTLQFWGAAGEVTGSCFLLQVGKHRLLVDCGLIQGRPADEARNRQPFPFPAEQLDAVILTHAHLDHSGRLPLLLKAGFRGPIYAHHGTRDLCRIMLRDAGYINEKEAEWENRKRRRKGLRSVTPLYTMAEAQNTLDFFHPQPYDQHREILPGVEVTLRDAGHILGSSIVELRLQHAGTRRKLVFSGDLGHRGAPIMRDPVFIQQADLVVMESTYGNRAHRGWQATWEELAGVLRAASRDGGNILIPAFAVGRTQDLLYAFARHYEAWDMGRWEVFLDSPLAIEATEIYSRHTDLYDEDARHFWRSGNNPFLLPNVHISRSAEESMAINRIRSGAIIIAGSGMCEGGRIKHHLKHNAWRDNCHIVIVGFQVAGTLGRALVDGAGHIRLWGEAIKREATVHTLGGFSAHADQHGLLNWYGHFHERPPLALVHGEQEATATLRRHLEEQGSTVHTPQYGTSLDLRQFR